jgi:hypothetical protein
MAVECGVESDELLNMGLYVERRCAGVGGVG